MKESFIAWTGTFFFSHDRTGEARKSPFNTIFMARTDRYNRPSILLISSIFATSQLDLENRVMIEKIGKNEVDFWFILMKILALIRIWLHVDSNLMLLAVASFNTCFFSQNSVRNSWRTRLKITGDGQFMSEIPTKLQPCPKHVSHFIRYVMIILELFSKIEGCILKYAFKSFHFWLENSFLKLLITLCREEKTSSASYWCKFSNSWFRIHSNIKYQLSENSFWW